MFTIEQITHFWTHVNVQGPGDCWDWLGFTNNIGHGVAVFTMEDVRNDVSFLAHRIAFFLGYRRRGIFTRKFIHLCVNPACCNPNHLMRSSPGTDVDYDYPWSMEWRDRCLH